MNLNQPKAGETILTQSNKHVAKCTWVINNFSYIQKELGTKIESPKFLAPFNSDIQFSLDLYPFGFRDDNKGWLSIYAKTVSESGVRAKYKTCILNSNPERSKISQSNDVKLLKASQTLGHYKIMPLVDLMEENNCFLSEDKLTILCEISFICDSINISGIAPFKIPECKIAEDFGNLLDSRKLSDVIIIAGEHKQELPAHKAILAARSNVFAAMFEYEMKEAKSNTITITDIDCEVLHEMLRFIYTGNTRNLKEMAKELLAAADKYELTILKALSEEAVFAELSIENAIEILSFADLYSAKQLKEKTIIFIKAHAKEIIKTDGWQTMKKALSYLAVELFEQLCTENEDDCQNLPSPDP
ncbi:protein roadkill-like [Eupeodes corollae]|uniref:protein roadkill-like n=1 Tax=Eupeodes corollae TaxID=290404 RepID=UPI002491F6C9|nr:protein roadkill-like [Eupeodes corollae]